MTVASTADRLSGCVVSDPTFSASPADNVAGVPWALEFQYADDHQTFRGRGSGCVGLARLASGAVLSLGTGTAAKPTTPKVASGDENAK
jgi:hypothetical protein